MLPNNWWKVLSTVAEDHGACALWDQARKLNPPEVYSLDDQAYAKLGKLGNLKGWPICSRETTQGIYLPWLDWIGVADDVTDPDEDAQIIAHEATHWACSKLGLSRNVLTESEEETYTQAVEGKFEHLFYSYQGGQDAV